MLKRKPYYQQVCFYMNNSSPIKEQHYRLLPIQYNCITPKQNPLPLVSPSHLLSLSHLYLEHLSSHLFLYLPLHAGSRKQSIKGGKTDNKKNAKNNNKPKLAAIVALKPHKELEISVDFQKQCLPRSRRTEQQNLNRCNLGLLRTAPVSLRCRCWLAQCFWGSLLLFFFRNS